MSRRKLMQGNLVFESNSQTAVFNPSTKTESFPTDFGASLPRVEPVSQSIFGFSPQKQAPSASLDLSESDSDITSKAEQVLAASHKSDRDVVVVDALSQRILPDLAEVSIRESIGKSPYKVVCHSPRAAKLSLRNITEVPEKVQIHKPKSVYLAQQGEEQELEEKCHTESSSSTLDAHMSLGASLLVDEGSDHQEVPSSNVPAKLVSQVQKKKGREVASRLMQPTASHRAKSVTQTQQDSSQPSKLKKTNLSSSTSRSTKGDSTPKKTTQSKRQVSTPENIAPNESFDVSALQTNKTICRLLNETESFLAKPDPEQNESVPDQPTVKGKLASSKVPVENITQDVIDVNYARYLQWLFLASKAHTSIENEEKQVLEQLESLWLENRRMRQKLSHLDNEYDRLQQVTDLDEMLNLQKTSLNPIINELPQLNSYYKSMALALDTTRHELQTSGIFIPDTKDKQMEFEEDLMSALDESDQLLAQITALTRRYNSTSTQYSQVIDNLSSSVSEQEKLLSKCRNLVKTSQTLSNQENSLMIQEIEFSRV